MKALTLTQPWATFVALGVKTLETRSWKTEYRGPLAIHAAKTFPGFAKAQTETPAFWEVVEAHGLVERRPDGVEVAKFPLGAVVATVQLVDCFQFTDDFDPGEQLHFGNFEVGRWGFVLSDIRAVQPPIPARGALGLWEWEGSEVLYA